MTPVMHHLDAMKESINETKIASFFPILIQLEQGDEGLMEVLRNIESSRAEEESSSFAKALQVIAQNIKKRTKRKEGWSEKI